jgi:hypothetical protein
MATTAAQIKYEIKHFNNFCKYLPGYQSMCQKTVNKLLHTGMIQVSTAFEHALAKVGKFKVVSESYRDGSDGSDAKLVTSSFHRGKCDAMVSNTKNKIGKLRVQVYEKHQDKFYYFVIPQSEHSKVTYLEIPFHEDGSPKRVTLHGNISKWWVYEVDTFKELATT